MIEKPKKEYKICNIYINNNNKMLNLLKSNFKFEFSVTKKI